MMTKNEAHEKFERLKESLFHLGSSYLKQYASQKSHFFHHQHDLARRLCSDEVKELNGITLGEFLHDVFNQTKFLSNTHVAIFNLVARSKCYPAFSKHVSAMDMVKDILYKKSGGEYSRAWSFDEYLSALEKLDCNNLEMISYKSSSP